MGLARGPLTSMVLVLLIMGLTTLATSTPSVAQEPYHPRLEFDAEVTPHPEPVEPIRGGGTAHIMLKVTCQPPGTSIEPQRVGLRIEIEDEEHVTATLSKTQFIVAFEDQECIATSATLEFETDATISFGAEAPAFQERFFRLYASYGENETMVAEWVPQPGFFERWEARFDQSVLQAAQGETIRLPGTIENLGNGPIEVELLQDRGPEFGQIVLPSPLKIQAGESGNIEPFHIDYKGNGTGRDNVFIQFIGHSVDDPSIGLEPITRPFVVHVEWVPIGEAPVAPTALLGLALLGVLVALRRHPPNG